LSIQRIRQYKTKVAKAKRRGGSSEEAIRPYFWELLGGYGREHNLELVTELYYTQGGDSVKPDGTLKDALRQDWGYWESKDEDDDLEREIAKKFAKGYPSSNILFEDSNTAVLIQAGLEVARAPFRDDEALHAILTRFVSYETPQVRAFREAIDAFTEDVPELAEALRGLIREQYEGNAAYRRAADDFLELCREAINPAMNAADVREMIVQHVLTEDIFITVFGDPQFHQENVIARELGEVVDTFYTGRTRRTIDARIEGYTQAIKARAAQIQDHQEKQRFLKVLYTENWPLRAV
jgi:predicted helicase